MTDDSEEEILRKWIHIGVLEGNHFSFFKNQFASKIDIFGAFEIIKTSRGKPKL